MSRVHKKKIEIGELYRNIIHHERVVQILGLNRNTVNVRYVSTTNKENLGVEGRLYRASLHYFYERYAHTKPSWEV